MSTEHYILEIHLDRDQMRSLKSIARTYARVFRLLTYSDDLARAKLVTRLIQAAVWVGREPEGDARDGVEELIQ